VFKALAADGVNVDMIVQTVSSEGTTDISFTVPKSDLERTDALIRSVAADVGAAGVATDPNIAKISLIGAGMRTHPGVAAEMFQALADAGINIGMISTSSIRLSCVVPAKDVERAVQAVHARFALHEPAVAAELG
jgi:aspartate kinase